MTNPSLKEDPQTLHVYDAAASFYKLTQVGWTGVIHCKVKENSNHSRLTSKLVTSTPRPLLKAHVDGF